jgi:uncharacterized membrane protein YeaQ/YmgE (transglycosylase-associated protein family)
MRYVPIGLGAGWLAAQLVKGGGFGIIGDTIVGVFGAVLGGVLCARFVRRGRQAWELDYRDGWRRGLLASVASGQKGLAKARDPWQASQSQRTRCAHWRHNAKPSRSYSL